MKKSNMKYTSVFDGSQSVEDIFSALLLEDYEKEQAKRRSRKSDFVIDTEIVMGYNGNRFISYLAGMCG